MLRRIFWILVGVIAALQADRWFRERRRRFTPNAITGSLLDKINERLEANRNRTGR
jgi:hypothetical protein